MKKEFLQKGFTTLEIMLVASLMAIALGFSILFHQSSQVRTDLNNQAAILVSYLRLAQTNAQSGRTNQPNALHLEQNAFTTFSGATYSVSNPTNFILTLPPTIVIENIALNGNGADIIFNAPRGETNTYGSFDLTSSQISKSLTINISSLGIINY
jgi:type II secretory pathway pseudopilin PulG